MFGQSTLIQPNTSHEQQLYNRFTTLSHQKYNNYLSKPRKMYHGTPDKKDDRRKNDKNNNNNKSNELIAKLTF